MTATLKAPEPAKVPWISSTGVWGSFCISCQTVVMSANHVWWKEAEFHYVNNYIACRLFEVASLHTACKQIL